ncbi:MAG: serine/threonine-protein kinase [Actinomycetota bacterium]
MSGDERIGTQIAGYRIQSLLGRGGMGVVYRAEHVTLERPAALKILAGELARDASLRDRFIRESRLAASLDHPHIVPVYDAGESDGSFYLVMRLIEGRDLKKVIGSESPLEPLRVATLLVDVADALDAAHEVGLVHRDVKPENVLVGARRGGGERPYLTDFGLTKRRDSASALTATGTMLGTIDYIAPEQVQGEDTDGRADVYALGCVAYECLTGRPPFAKDSDMSTLYAHVHDEAAPAGSLRAGLPLEIDSVLARAMAKDREHRYQSCG